jgi:hypothetical protein
MEVDEEKYSEYIKIFLKKNVISKDVVMWMNYEGLSDNYGWTPSEIDAQDPYVMDIYMAILAGKAKRQKATMGSKKAKRMMR